MRVTDLARKLNLKTEDLRARLPKFGVRSDAKELTAEQAQKVSAALSTPGAAKSVDTKKKEEDSGPELMGLMFDDEPTGMLIESDEPAAEPAKQIEDVATEEEPEEEDADEEDEAPIVTTPEPQKPAPVVAAPAPARPPVGVTGFTRTTRSAADVAAARERWATAKRASEKIIEKKKTTPGAVVAARAPLPRRRGKFGAPDPVEELIPVPKKKTLKELVIDKTQPKRKIAITDIVTIRELAEKIGISPIRIVAELFKQGVISNVNATIDFDTASIISESFWCEIIRDNTVVSSDDLLKGNIEKLLIDEPENLSPRAPIVAVMGHVDHGKTTLLDTIRKANVAGGESGGITQHIGAYQVEHNGRKITFLDTPGHEAFTAIRARGARATDIAVLVVAAEDGVKPQTLEALNHAREAGVPIVVAMTKVDKPEANIERTKTMLSEHDLIPSDWGGKTEMVPVSAKENRGISELLEIILLTNDVEPVLANPNRLAVGTIIESHLDKSLGPVVTVVINTGTLRVGDSFIVGPVVGRVKKMIDWNGKSLKAAPPGTPVQLAGLPELPQRGVGEILQAFPDTASARAKADEFARIIEIRNQQKVSSMGALISRINTGKIKELKIVLKADVDGSLEAIRGSLEKIVNVEVRPKIIHAGVGDVTETDVLMAESADALLLAFHVGVPPHVAKIADHDRVTIRRHTIIYKLIEEVEKMLSGLLDPEIVETELGSLEVRGVFLTKPSEQIIGGMVTDGHLETNALVRIHRGGVQVAEGKLTGLKREKEDVREIRQGYECGLRIAVKNFKIELGDIIEAYKIEKKIRAI